MKGLTTDYRAFRQSFIAEATSRDTSWRQWGFATWRLQRYFEHTAVAAAAPARAE
jgi:hypothetical protein